MADYVAGRGTTALGIIGTTLGGLAVAAPGLLGGMGGWGNNYGAYNMPIDYQRSGACMHDVETAEVMAQKDSEIARLRSEKYADGVRDDAKQYGIEIYKELKGDLTRVTKELSDELVRIKDRQNDKWTDQAVINANVTNGITALNGQVAATANLVAQITRTAVPQSAICNFGNTGCTACGNNI